MTIQAVRELGRNPVNSTGSMSTQYSEEAGGVWKLYSYNTCVGYSGRRHGLNKVVIVDTFYSMTTSQHLAKFRAEYGVDRNDCYEYDAFIKRAELDGVNVLGGWNN